MGVAEKSAALATGDIFGLSHRTYVRVLICGAGVIGSLYATLFSQAGYDVSVVARGRRLKELEKKGLLYLKGKGGCNGQMSMC